MGGAWPSRVVYLVTRETLGFSWGIFPPKSSNYKKYKAVIQIKVNEILLNLDEWVLYSIPPFTNEMFNDEISSYVQGVLLSEII